MSKNHRKLSAAQVLAENLKSLMGSSGDLSTGPKVAKAAKVSRKTINNIASNRHDPHLSQVDAIAKAFKLEAYQVLTPGIDNNLLAIYRTYRETGEAGQQLLISAAETARRIHDRKTADRAASNPDE